MEERRVQKLAEAQYAAALRAAEEPRSSPEERAEMLMEIAMGIQLRPASPQQLHDALALYERALDTLTGHPGLLRARVLARMGTALQALPAGGSAALRRARECYERALEVLREQGSAEEGAEAQMNLGLVLQALAGAGEALIQDAIRCYHTALRVFSRERHAREFAILHNNLAIAYLSIPASDERGRMREALAVQSFEEVLKVINIVEHPSEYAMIQNNLGNALQYAATGHALENSLRALDAYAEALKVRNRRDTPLEYANTIANMANVLRNLEPEGEMSAQEHTLARAGRLYAEARALFEEHGLQDQAAMVAEALAEVDSEMRRRGLEPGGRSVELRADKSPAQAGI
jgi:tetratricopeptide (TPR) repeat protein